MSEPEVWSQLQGLTHARVGLGRSGTSLPTEQLLRLRADQITASASVHAQFDLGSMREQLLGVDVLEVSTLATDRGDYLRHPDHGRTLSQESRDLLRAHADDWDVAFILSDGLSTEAAQRNAVPTLRATLDALGPQMRIAPIVLAPFARVGLLNDAGAALGARCAVILLGERPGLSAADSLGAYLEHDPRPGATDADRNCISNIRRRGLDPQRAGAKLAWLITQSLAIGRSGTTLKAEYPRELES